MKIAILNKRNRFRDEDLETLDNNGAVFFEERGTTLDRVINQIGTADFVLGVQPGFIESGYKGLAFERIKNIKNLKGICLSTTAYGWVPLVELKSLGIPVTNVPGKSTDSVGEYYVFMMIALLRKLPQIMKNNWSFSYTPNLLGTEAKSLKVGIVGLGAIGQKIAKLCTTYEMNVSYWSQHKKQVPYNFEEIVEIFKTSDVIFVCVVADVTTKGMITHQLIDSMKKTAIFLSPVDELVFDRAYVLKKVANNEIGGLGFETHRHTITDFKGNVFPAPEVGYFTKQAIANESRILTESIISIVNGNPVNTVNL